MAVQHRTKRWVQVIAVILAILFLAGCAESANAPVRVQWRDDAVKSAALEELGKKENDPIYFDEITSIRHLVIRSEEPVNLTDLSGLRNLESVDLSGAVVSDLTPLLACTKLKVLRIGDSISYSDHIEILEQLQNSISDSDIDVDKNYYSLFPVSFTDPAIDAAVRRACGKNTGDLTQADIRTIRELKIADEKLTAPSELGQLFRLRELTLNNCGLTSVQWVSSLPQLLLLDVDSNELTSLNGIEQITGLQALSASFNKIDDLSCISSLKDLFALSVNQNPLKDPAQIGLQKNLTNLSANGCGIEDLSMLSGMNKMEVLWLNDNMISDITVISSMKKLKTLGLISNELTSVDALSGCTKITDLYLADNNIKDISALSNMKDLKRLQLTMNNVSDVTPISGLGELRELSMLSNPVLDYSPLLNAPHDWDKIDVDLELAQQACETAAGIASEIAKETSDPAEQIKSAHQQVILLTKYDYDAASQGGLGFTAQSAYAALIRGRSVCVGYAESMTMILKQLGIETYMVYGDGSGVEHAWIMCVLNGTTYYVDATWDDPDQGTLVYTDYLLVDAEKMRENHNWNESLFQ